MFVHNPDVIVTELEGELVLLNPRTQAIFSLNATGSLIWEHLGNSSAEDHAARLAERFLVDLETARRDVDALTKRLETAGLILVRS